MSAAHCAKSAIGGSVAWSFGGGGGDGGMFSDLRWGINKVVG